MRLLEYIGADDGPAKIAFNVAPPQRARKVVGGLAKAAAVVEVPHNHHPVTIEPPQVKRKEFPFTGFVDFQGLKIDVENRAGSYREGKDKGGHAWKIKMRAGHYGEIRDTTGTDGDNLDVYVGPNHDSSLVVVIRQHKPDTGAFDEDKVMVGYDSVEQAIGAYKLQYDKPGFYKEGDYLAMPIGKFWRWVHDERQQGKKVASAFAKIAYENISPSTWSGGAGGARVGPKNVKPAPFVPSPEQAAGLKQAPLLHAQAVARANPPTAPTGPSVPLGMRRTIQSPAELRSAQPGRVRGAFAPTPTAPAPIPAAPQRAAPTAQRVQQARQNLAAAAPTATAAPAAAAAHEGAAVAEGAAKGVGHSALGFAQKHWKPLAVGGTALGVAGAGLYAANRMMNAQPRQVQPQITIGIGQPQRQGFFGGRAQPQTVQMPVKAASTGVSAFAAKRADHVDPAQVNTQALLAIAQPILVCLLALYQLYYFAHWTAKGQSSYSDHQLFERLYKSTQEEYDKLAERLVGLVGTEAVDGVFTMAAAKNEFWVKQCGQGDSLLAAQNGEQETQAVLANAYRALDEHMALTLGLDELIMNLASQHETNSYLLKQRADAGAAPSQTAPPKTAGILARLAR